MRGGAWVDVDVDVAVAVELCVVSSLFAVGRCHDVLRSSCGMVSQCSDSSRRWKAWWRVYLVTCCGSLVVRTSCL